MNNFHFIAPPGKRLRLQDYDSSFTGKFEDEHQAAGKIQADCQTLAELQDMLLAEETHALLLIFQAMDGSAKDGTIKYVMSNVDPQGAKACNFKEPSREELQHDYLWRFVKELPARGQIGIFNRSYYEEVLVIRVHPEKLEAQHLPDRSSSNSARLAKNLWRARMTQINNFEHYLVENGIVILKFFLHLSHEKQRERLLERATLREKQWKFSISDVEERGFWDDYMKAYEDMLQHTSTRHAPWHIIPADHRWFTQLAVADLIVAKLKALKLKYPTPNEQQQQQLAQAKKQLESG